MVKGDKPGENQTYTILTLKDNKLKESQKRITTDSERGKLMPTDTGIVVNDFLLEHFPQIMDYNFTADVERSFDDIAEGKRADLVVIDLHRPNMQPVNNIAKNLVFAGSKENVRLTMVNGRVLYEKGSFFVGEAPEEIYRQAALFNRSIL